MLGQKRISFVALAMFVGLMLSVGVQAEERTLVRSLFKNVDPDETSRPVTDAEAAELEQVVAAAAGAGCQPVGGTATSAFGQFRYRGNVLHIDAADAKLNEFKMLLQFTGAATLSFSIHKRDISQDPEVWTRVFLKNVLAVGNNTQQMYSSGPLPMNVSLLQADTDYAFGVTWGTTTVFFVRSNVNQPQQLAAKVGRSLGLLAYNGVQPPIDQELPSPTIATVGAFQMEFCFEPVPGACCLSSAEACVPVKATECVDAGSRFHGERTECTEVPCFFGACCSPCDNDCENHYTPEACTAANGTHHRGATCPTVAGGPAEFCPESLGACCNGAVCEVKCPTECTTGGGAYQGDGTDCTPNVCVGACCIGGDEDRCGVYTQNTCTQFFHGGFQGYGTECALLQGPVVPMHETDPHECGGACCFSEGVASCVRVVERADCNDAAVPNAIYLGDGTECIDGGCPNIATVAACCLPNGTCLNTDSTVCTQLQGERDGNNKKCGDQTRDACEQRGCCSADGTCQFRSVSKCLEFLDTPVDSCDEGICDQALPKGACCLAVGCFSDLTESTCHAFDGIYKGTDSECTPELCEGLGSCCTPESTCRQPMTSSFCVDDLKGSFHLGVPCAEVNCDHRGACCTQGGNCMFVNRAECPNAIVAFRGEDTDCNDEPTPCFYGACCMGDGTCAIRGRDFCKLSDGKVYQGDFTGCIAGLCTPGACCTGTTCDDDFDNGYPLVRSQCTLQGRVFGPGQVCTADTCVPGFCCLPTSGGECQDLSRLECTLEGGVYHTGEVCSGPDPDAPCRRGACCSLGGVCQDVYAFECDPPSDFNLNELCANRACQVRGACCVPGSSQCQVLTPVDCALANGTYAGDEQPCDTERCRNGACCLGDGTCENRKPQACNDPENGLVYQGDDSICTAGRCTTGACCNGETCADEVVLSQCTGPGAVFRSGKTCAAGSCEVGICCLTASGGSCQNLTGFDCSAAGGRYHGDSICPTGEVVDPPCALGACCLLSGQCQEGIFAFECAASSGAFTPGGLCANVSLTCAARGACCVFGNEQCQIKTQAECATAMGVYSGDGVPCSQGTCMAGACCKESGDCANAIQSACNMLGGLFQGSGTACNTVECPLFCHDLVASSSPANCAVDPGYPHTPQETPARLRWKTLDLTFECSARTDLIPTDFSVREVPPNGVPRAINSVALIPADLNSVRLTFDQFIKLGRWTCVTHVLSGEEVCIGFLPGDVNADGHSDADDLTAIVTNLDAPTLSVERCDIDRSGGCYATDLIQEIDLQNGADPMFDKNTMLPDCPTAP